MMRAENPNFEVSRAAWPRHAEAIADIRRRVFIQEQGVPEELEWEAADSQCHWFVARAGEALIGVARLSPDGRIGRMAVLPEWRRRGVGSALLRCVLHHAHELGLRRVSVHAQVQAMPFYARFGFQPDGTVFMEAGIPHRLMSLQLQKGQR